MNENVYEVLKRRGFIKNCTNEKDVIELLGKEKITCYVGFDPTAPSLHVGHLLPIMALSFMQKYGHRPIAIVGGGTALIGDPSGKTEMRKILTKEQIDENAEHIKKQLEHFIDFSNGKALLLNNADWLCNLNYIEFLRDIGIHFSVNRMLATEAYKQRLERGLNFIEFNYQILQAYDFLILYERYNCKIQMGGDDQWGNIVAGIDLIRRIKGVEVYGITFPLITTSSGAKMGKTEAGAVWLDPEKTSPFDYFQFWRNTEDPDVERFLLLFTFLDENYIKELCREKGSALNKAKEILAYEATKLVHGEEEAKKALDISKKLFYQDLSQLKDLNGIPELHVSLKRLKDGIRLVNLLVESNLCPSKSEAKRLIKQGGAYVNKKQIRDIDFIVSNEHLVDNKIILKAGKKKFAKIIVE